MKKLLANKKLLTDLILVLSLLLLSGVLYLALNGGGEEGAYVLVRVDGVDTDRYSLTQNGTYELNGGTNILVIRDGYAMLTDADCPDKLCVKQGKIHITGQCITCLPNKLTVTVYGADSEVELFS